MQKITKINRKDYFRNKKKWLLNYVFFTAYYLETIKNKILDFQKDFSLSLEAHLDYTLNDLDYFIFKKLV